MAAVGFSHLTLLICLISSNLTSLIDCWIVGDKVDLSTFSF